MSPSTRLLCRAVVAANRRTLNPTATLRQYSDQPYPFTKPKESTPSQTRKDEAPKAAYPFTQPTGPKVVAPPTRPTPEPGPPKESSELVSSEAMDEGAMLKPDYGAMEDYRTSTYSPVPLGVMDGSEDNEITPAAVISGAPTELQARTVRIYKPAKTATQSGEWHGHHWQMDWDVLAKGHRWENPLMGWQSSGDFMQGTKVSFKTKEDAIRFAEKQGYEYFVQEPQERRMKPKQYQAQFVHNYGPLKQVRTK